MNASPPVIVTVACKTAVFGKFGLDVNYAGTAADTSKTATTVNAPPVNTFRTIARSTSASPCHDGLRRPTFVDTKQAGWGSEVVKKCWKHHVPTRALCFMDGHPR